MKIIVNRKEKRAETAAVGALPRRLQAASEGEKRGFFERFGRRTLDFPARFFIIEESTTRFRRRLRRESR